jgi:RHS repeat-associated protein
VTETFEHDNLGRLEKHYKANALVGEYGYDDKGNLTKSPTVGKLNYTGPNPHQVMTTEDLRSFAYVDGNQTERTGDKIPDGHQKIAYSAFDLPVEIKSGLNESAPNTVTTFHYNADNERVAQFSSTGTRVMYVGQLYQRTTTPNAPEEHLVRIPTPDGLSIEASIDDGNKAHFRFLETDHLGSVVGVLDENRANGEPRSYSAFGEITTGNVKLTRTGFTSHEMDSALGLINMRGRVYDPALGRFLTPDPVVQSPGNSQSWNPYSYVMNRPLNAVDPSGFEGELPEGVANTISVDCDPGGCFQVGPITAVEEQTAGELAATPGVAVNGGGVLVGTSGMGDSGGHPGGGGGAHAGGGGGAAHSAPVAAYIDESSIPVGPSEIEKFISNAGAFVGGFVQGAVATAAFTAAIGYGSVGLAAAGTAVGIAGAATAAPLIAGVTIGVLAVAGIYELAFNGGGQKIVSSFQNIWTTGGNPQDWQLTGAIAGSFWAGLRAPSILHESMEMATTTLETAHQLGIVPRGVGAGSARAYSTAFEARLSPKSYPGVSRARHFQEANEQLLGAMEASPEFAGQMSELGVKLEPTVTGLAPRTPPPGWTWHHEVEAGLMRLVPRAQHSPGSSFWDVLHPGGRGGYSIWGQW